MLRVSPIPKPHVSTISGPVIVGSFLALIFVLRLPLLRRQSRGMKWSMSTLRQALLGHRKKQVSAMLGPPRVVTDGLAAVWYYPVDSADRLAMAVSFEHERVRSVEFFKSPA
jgi:outer membrane protein assembly factor BamE (lipoprotein component of BamABCDE complex)